MSYRAKLNSMYIRRDDGTFMQVGALGGSIDSDDKWELIQEVTLAEKIMESYWDLGNAYKKLLIFLTFPNTLSVVNNTWIGDSVSIWGTHAIIFPNLYTNSNGAIISITLTDGMLFSDCWSVANQNTGMVYTQRDNGNSHQMNIKPSDLRSLERVRFGSQNGFDAGTTVKIYGVRV